MTSYKVGGGKTGGQTPATLARLHKPSLYTDLPTYIPPYMHAHRYLLPMPLLMTAHHLPHPQAAEYDHQLRARVCNLSARLEAFVHIYSNPASS